MKEEDILREENFERPVDFYGETKIYAEKEVIKLIGQDFTPTILRFSTVYGLSPRMRFDLVVNTFVKNAMKNKEIVIFKGNQWRPLINVDDLARAIKICLEAPLAKVGNQIFNVGDNKENYSITGVGDIVKECLPEIKITNIEKTADNRSYKVCFDKIEKVLGFKAEKTVKDGVLEMVSAWNEGRFGDAENKIYYNHLVT
jgi:nucleoside-diphosphate-sugar epimerase